MVSRRGGTNDLHRYVTRALLRAGRRSDKVCLLSHRRVARRTSQHRRDGRDADPRFHYIEDVTDAFLHVLRYAETGAGYLEYEVGSGQPTRLKDFVEHARATCGSTTTELRFGALAYRANEQMNVVADTSR